MAENPRVGFVVVDVRADSDGIVFDIHNDVLRSQVSNEPHSLHLWMAEADDSGLRFTLDIGTDKTCSTSGIFKH